MSDKIKELQKRTEAGQDLRTIAVEIDLLIKENRRIAMVDGKSFEEVNAAMNEIRVLFKMRADAAHKLSEEEGRLVRPSDL